MAPNCSLGKLVVKGSDIRFEKAPSFDFSLRGAQNLEFGFDYEVIEASGMKEKVILKLRIEPETGGKLDAKVEISDKLGAKDVTKGALVCKVPTPMSTRLEGRFEIDADHGKKSWIGFMRGATSSFNFGDRFSVTLMPDTPKATMTPRPKAK